MSASKLKTLLFFSVTVFGGIWGDVSSAIAETYLPGTEDVPLMPGFEVLPAETVDFDTPAGQIVLVTMQSKDKTADSFFDFYRSTLQALGWQYQQKGYFTRDKDTLSWHVEKKAAPTRIRFDIFLNGGI